MSLSVLRILAGSDSRVFAEAIKKYGLKVVGIKNMDPLETKVQFESVSAIASTITEDADYPVDLPKTTVQAMRIAEEFGYIVKVLEEMGLPDEEEGGVAAAPAPAKPRRRTQPGRRPGPAKPSPQPRRKPFNPPRPQEDPAPKACRGM